MDNFRIVLWVGVALMFWVLFETWRADYPRVPPAATDPLALPGSELAPESPLDLPALPEAPGVGQAQGVARDTGPGAAGLPAAPQPELTASPFVRVRTDVLDLEIDLQGGDIRAARLPQYPVRKDDPDTPVQLLSRDPADLYIFRSGLRGADGQPEPNHRALFESAQAEYRLAPGANELLVPLTWQDADGVTVTKTYRLRRGRYDVGLEYLVENASAEPWRAASYLQIQRRHRPPDRSLFNVESYSFRGPVMSDGRKYSKLKPEDLARTPETQQLAGGWLAAIEHHFLAAVVPPAEETWSYEARASDGVFLLSAISPVQAVAPGDRGRFEGQLFVGPKLQEQLVEVAPKLPKTVDYGLLSLLAEPLFWLLQKVYGFIGNWGWSIIFVTFLIKLVFYKLTETSGRSMAKMRKLQPRLKALQERYKDDRQAMSTALMDMYKREKINPAAGCLPMLVQIPFFIAFYWVLLESVEMRQAPFMLWITDLSARDPWFILPLCMGAAMYFQQKLNPAPPDPIQAKVMAFLPWVFMVFFAFFPAGLVLYWLTNSLLSIAQQWRINKVVGAD
jgi:YidC/Oxa1 family membrane protein insertase